jgi:hypothetical protein
MQKLLSTMVLVIAGYVLNAQSLDVIGSIRDSKGLPIPGVNILIKGTPTGAVSNSEGHFKVDVPYGTHVLVYSFIGYKSVEQKVHVNAEFAWSLEIIMAAKGSKAKGSSKFVELTADRMK